MDKSIIIRRVVQTEFALLREPTKEELKMIQDDEVFDIEDLVDWGNSLDVDEDYSYSGIVIQVGGKEIFYRRGFRGDLDITR